MAEIQNRWGVQARTGTAAQSAVDEGLRAYMLRVYNYMGLGVAFTAIISLLVMSNPAVLRAVAYGPGKWILFFGILGLGFFAHRAIYSGSTVIAHGAYWLYCAMWGALLAPMVYVFFARGAGQLVFQALAITAVTFFATSLYGYVTKRNLSAFATFFCIASIGLLLAILVNALFVQSIGMSLVVSCGVVVLFAAVAAWETQEIKQMYIEGAGYGGTHIDRSAIFGAFLLYGTFVTLFSHILNILGIMRSD